MSLASPPAAVPRVSMLLLALIAFSGTLAMHMFVPALPDAASALGTDSSTIQLSITVYILGLACGQILYGPLSEAYGRRPAVLTGLAVFVAGTLACYLATDINSLLVARFVQALGGAGGLALTRVIVADTAKGASATKGIAILNMILMVGPGLAPVVGALISAQMGWRSIFLALIALGSLSIALSLKGLPETGRPFGQLSFARVIGDFKAMACNAKFRRVVSGGAFGSTACYAYFVSAPFILHGQMGLSVEAVGFCVGLTMVAAALGTILTRCCIGRVSAKQISLGFSGLGVLVGAIFTLCALLDWLNPVLVVVLSCLILFAAGAMGPVSIATAMADAGPQSGSASGLYGSVQMAVGGICSFGAGLFADHSLGCGLILLLAYAFSWVQFYRHG